MHLRIEKQDQVGFVLTKTGQILIVWCNIDIYFMKEKKKNCTCFCLVDVSPPYIVPEEKISL